MSRILPIGIERTFQAEEHSVEGENEMEFGNREEDILRSEVGVLLMSGFYLKTEGQVKNSEE